MHNSVAKYEISQMLFEVFVKPLLEYLNTQELKRGLIVGVTWSNNGAGTKKERKRIDMEMGCTMGAMSMKYLNNFYYGGNMNVCFYKKN